MGKLWFAIAARANRHSSERESSSRETWTIERKHSHVAVVTMNTNKVNAQNPAFFADLHAAFDRLEAEFSDCAVVLTGTGAVFTAGLPHRQAPEPQHKLCVTAPPGPPARISSIPPHPPPPPPP